MKTTLKFLSLNLLLVAFIFIVVASASYLGWSYEWGLMTFTAYGLVVLFRKFAQMVLAHLHNKETAKITRQPIINALEALYPDLGKRARDLLNQTMQFDRFQQALIKLAQPNDRKSFWAELIRVSWGEIFPTVGIVVPIYKTPFKELVALVRSLETQTYPGRFEVQLVLNEEDWLFFRQIQEFVQQLNKDGTVIHYEVVMQTRRGKRWAMEMGFRALLHKGLDYIFNMDSDSLGHEDIVSNAVRVFESDPTIGCLTGDIRVSNPNVNLLTILTEQRYFIAFNLERAAQAKFGAVTCMSGPFMGVRREFLEQILDEWVNQTFLEKECTYGDDRHISTLALKYGWKSLFVADCIGLTDVPTEVEVWEKQQTRWNRSAWRETLITLPWINRLPAWVIFDIAYQALFPLILAGIIGALLARSIVIALNPELGVLTALLALVPYTVVVLSIVVITHSLYGAVVRRDLKYFLNPFYLFHQFRYLLPIKFIALLSLNETGWGTK